MAGEDFILRVGADFTGFTSSLSNTLMSAEQMAAAGLLPLPDVEALKLMSVYISWVRLPTSRAMVSARV